MEFFSEEIRITIQIILIDLVLSADNAIVIGMTASQFNDQIRKAAYSFNLVNNKLKIFYIQYSLNINLRPA